MNLTITFKLGVLHTIFRVILGLYVALNVWLLIIDGSADNLLTISTFVVWVLLAVLLAWEYRQAVLAWWFMAGVLFLLTHAFAQDETPATVVSSLFSLLLLVTVTVALLPVTLQTIGRKTVRK